MSEEQTQSQTQSQIENSELDRTTAGATSQADDAGENVIEDLELKDDSICLDNPLRKFDIIDYHETYSNITNKKKTLPFLTNYEKTLIVGIRRQQVASGSKPMIDFQKKNLYTVNEIVDEELRRKMIPLLIRRYLPNNSFEDWKLEDLHYTV